MSNPYKMKMERPFILNPQTPLPTLTDAYNEYIEKIYALLQVSLCDGFSDCPKVTIYHYQVVISSLMDELRDLHSEITFRQEQRQLQN